MSFSRLCLMHTLNRIPSAITPTKFHDDIFSADDFSFKAGVEETRNYYLKVRWPENEKNEALAFEIGYFSVKIVATQID